MKKFMTLAAMFAAVMMSFTACDKDDTKKPNGKDEPDEPEFVAAITIDGDFADWATLEKESGRVAVTTQPDGLPNSTAAKVLKACTDAQYIYLYIEFDPAQEVAHMQIHMDADANAETGSPLWEFAEVGEDFLFEGDIPGFDPGIYPAADVEEGEWPFDESAVDSGSGVAVCSDIKTVNGNSTIEIAVMRELIPGAKFETNLKLGITLINVDWDGIGKLPIAEGGENGPMLTVKVVNE